MIAFNAEWWWEAMEYNEIYFWIKKSDAQVLNGIRCGRCEFIGQNLSYLWVVCGWIFNFFLDIEKGFKNILYACLYWDLRPKFLGLSLIKPESYKKLSIVLLSKPKNGSKIPKSSRAPTSTSGVPQGYTISLPQGIGSRPRNPAYIEPKIEPSSIIKIQNVTQQNQNCQKTLPLKKQISIISAKT